MPSRRFHKKRDEARIRVCDEENKMASRIQSYWRMHYMRCNDHKQNNLRQSMTSLLRRAVILNNENSNFAFQATRMRRMLHDAIPICCVCKECSSSKKTVLFYSRCCNMPICFECLYTFFRLCYLSNFQ